MAKRFGNIPYRDYGYKERPDGNGKEEYEMLFEDIYEPDYDEYYDEESFPHMWKSDCKIFPIW